MSLSRRIGRAKFRMSCESFTVITVVNLNRNIFARQRPSDGSLGVDFGFSLQHFQLKRMLNIDFDFGFSSTLSV